MVELLIAFRASFEVCKQRRKGDDNQVMSSDDVKPSFWKIASRKIPVSRACWWPSLDSGGSPGLGEDLLHYKKVERVEQEAKRIM